MSYITNKTVHDALKRMSILNQEVVDLFKKHGLSFDDNLGRRNGVLSHAQEKYFADELGKTFKNVVSDGKTGQPDIVIRDIEKELECKLTSGNGKYANFSLKTDYNTLARKKALDHLYVLADRSFNKFVVLHFESLTTDDFFIPAPGAKGKSRMRKNTAMKKCHVLWGGVEIKNEIEILKINQALNKANKEMRSRLEEISMRINNCSKRALKRHMFLKSLYRKEKKRYNKQLLNLSNRMLYWKNLDNAYSFILSPITDEENCQ